MLICLEALRKGIDELVAISLIGNALTLKKMDDIINPEGGRSLWIQMH